VDDAKLMERALELAARAEGSVSPRPCVGAVVISSDGEIVGEGFTARSPGPHAEVAALQAAGDRARGATVCVSLEPCSHQSVTPPCADALITAGIARVVVGAIDPDPRVNGEGVRMLRAAGIDVLTDVLREQAEALIEPFTHWVTTGRPFLTLKLAMTLDGKIAAPDGTSRWITGPQARAEVHELRRRCDAVMVGAGTVETDDPALTFREPGMVGSQPLRVLIDSSGRTPISAQLFDDAAPTLVLTTDDVAAGAWEHAGADVARVNRCEGGVDLDAVLEELGRRGICHLLCECGPTLAGTLVEQDLVDRFVLYLGPKLMGGDAPGAIGVGVKSIAEAWELDIERAERVGADLRIEAKRKR
jgi:diaminohydroxyphosphoribosylaminopyrimidine deaminase/5-amino-6-(5-phosphoribosylamino)uracil reductase